jgi:uncharacterized lipoprotein YehR (DUF1307 family)
MKSLRRLLLLSVVLVVFVSLCGCNRGALFSKNSQRNQFEAYNTMRYGTQITQQPDLFGLPEPALRERLGKKNK